MSSAADAPLITASTVVDAALIPAAAIDAAVTTAPENQSTHIQHADGKESSVGDHGTCNKEGCKSDKCKCTSDSGPSKSGKPEGCRCTNALDCAEGKCKLAKTDDPIKGICVAEKPPCETESGKKQCDQRQCNQKMKAESAEKQMEGQKKKVESDRERCPLTGDCDGSKQDSSLVVWHPNQGSPAGSGQTAEQKGDSTLGPKCGGLQPCAHSEDSIHKQEEHKICSPLPQGDKLKAVLFDIDGTIADSDPIHFLAFQEVLAEAGYNGGVPISHEFFIRQMSGKLNYVIAEELMPTMDEKKRIEMMDEKENRYRKLAAKGIQPVPGFLEFSEYVLKRGLRRAAVTNSPRLNAEQVIEALKIPHFFETIVVGSECDNPKPSPDPYLKAIKFLGVEASQCFVLEDSPSGVKAGRAAGSPVVGLLTGHPGPVLRDNGASVLIQDYHDSALWIALGEDHNENHKSEGLQGPDSTPSTGVPAPAPVPA